jgi:hypothetical protein
LTSSKTDVGVVDLIEDQLRGAVGGDFAYVPVLPASRWDIGRDDEVRER